MVEWEWQLVVLLPVDVAAAWQLISVRNYDEGALVGLYMQRVNGCFVTPGSILCMPHAGAACAEFASFSTASFRRQLGHTAWCGVAHASSGHCILGRAALLLFA